MKKLLVTALIFNFCAADAGLLNSIKSKMGTLKGKVTNVLDQQIANKTSGTASTSDTLILDPTVQTNLENTLKSMYTEASNIRNKNMLKPKILYYSTNLCVTLTKCINAPSATAANISLIENYIKELQNRGVDKNSTDSLAANLETLKSLSTTFDHSAVTIGDTTINSTVKQQLVNCLSEMNSDVLQISGTHLTDLSVVTNSALLQKKLQECIVNPSGASSSLSTISGYIQKLQGQSIDVTSLNQKLALLKEKVASLTGSGSSVDLSKINSNIQGEFLSASSDLQQEITKIQSVNSTNATLVSYSGQINTMLVNCSQTFAVTQNHISSLDQYVQWVKGQGIDVTSLSMKVANFAAKVMSLNTAIATANMVTTAATAPTAASVASTSTVPVSTSTASTAAANTANTSVSTGTAAATGTSSGSTRIRR